jgi:hypothetical protein
LNFDQLYPARTRDHEANHIRHVDLQALDALLRIEEVLVRIADMQQVLVAALPPKALVEALTDVETPPSFDKSAKAGTKKPRAL